MFSFLKAIFAVFFVVGCSTSKQQARDGYYQKDLLISEHGRPKTISGFGVLPKRSKYLLDIKSRKRPEIIRLSNCHRDLVYRGRDTSHKFKYDFIPNRKIENGSCLFQFSFLDSKGYHQWGAVSFVDDETLKANLYCNGRASKTIGVSACQAKSGTIQVIELENESDVRGQKGCEKPTTKDGLAWSFKVKEGLCFYIFKSVEGDFHRLDTYGYNDIVKQ